MATITIENVSKIYDGKVVGVDNISLLVEDGEFMAFLGPSGCGKTSTLRMIAGLEEITKGNMYFDANRVNEIPSNQRNVAMAFENYGLYPHLTVYQNIAYPLTLRDLPQKRIEKDVINIVRLLQLERYVDEKPGGLSGGVQQRISLARALVRQPAVLLLDEPISHLDAELRNQMRGELKRIHALNQTTTVYVTHDQLEALTMADRIAVMHQGKIRQVGTPRDIFYSPSDLFVATFVGEPPMNIIDGVVKVSDEEAEVWAKDNLIEKLPVRKASYLLEDVARCNQEVHIGIRPMDFNLSDSPTMGIKTSIHLREHLGEKILYHLMSDVGQLMFITTQDDPYKEGDQLYLIPKPKRIHFFSKETTLVIKMNED